MKFKKVIVTSGPTREWIDPVRFISNASSGKMGFCIASESSTLADKIVYIHGPVLKQYSEVNGAKNIQVDTTIEMRDVILSELEENTLVIMAAAPADFRPINSSEKKIKKTENSGVISIEMVENPDILLALKNKIETSAYLNCKLVGFAAESHDLEKHAMGKLHKKGLSFIVGNYVNKDGVGIGEVDSSVKIYGAEGALVDIGPAGKEEIAKGVVDFLMGKL